MKEKELTASCGLYCGDCIRFECRASDLAEALLAEVDNSRFRKYAEVKRIQAKEFGHFDAFISTLKALSGMKCVLPCGAGGDGCGGNCPIIRCVKEKALNGCWECGDIETCENLRFLKQFHGDAILENLKKIQKHGIEHWATYREKCYPWL